MARVDGKVRFVPGALPGERVRAVRTSRRRSFDRMQVEELLEPSPDRLRPLCPHLVYCGGCRIQALRYEEQLRAKAQHVRDCLRRIGGLVVDEPAPPIPSPRLTGYRNKMEFTFAPRPWYPSGPPEGPPDSWEGPALGLHVAGRFDAVFDLESCRLPGGRAVQALHLTRAWAREHRLSGYRSRADEGFLRHLVIREGKNTGDLLLAPVTRHAEPPLDGLVDRLREGIEGLTGVVRIVNPTRATIARGEQTEVLWGSDTIRERLLDLDFELGAQSFFQTNTWGAEALVGRLRQMLEPYRGGRVLDLYSGVGTLGLALAGRYEQVLGVETVQDAVLDARKNAVRNGIENAVFRCGDVEAWLMEPAADASGLSDADGIVVDPPRAGLHPRSLQSIPRLGAQWIAYVSCNPSTLARDAQALVESGYHPRALSIVDLFPHTAHVESILVMSQE